VAAELKPVRTPASGHIIFSRQSTKWAVGNNPPIVLVHGLGTSSRYMVPTARRLLNDFPVYAPDLPGFGYSSKPKGSLDIGELADVLANWMTAVGLSSAAMVGNSVGCQVIAEFGIRHKGRLNAAVLQGPTMDATDRSPAGQFIRFLTDLPREKLPEYAINAHDYWRAGIRRLLQTFQIALRDRIEDKLPRLAIPVLVMRGTNDPIVSDAWVRLLTDLLPNGRLVSTRGAHTPNFSEPDSFAAVIRAFLKA
jgi:pimeloyl-ACP methyl ester carboxylesterase